MHHCYVGEIIKFFFSSRRRHTRSVSAFLLNRSSDLAACRPIMSIDVVEVVIWRESSVSGGSGADRKSGSAGMPRPISYAVFCLKKKNKAETISDHGQGSSSATAITDSGTVRQRITHR